MKKRRVLSWVAEHVEDRCPVSRTLESLPIGVEIVSSPVAAEIVERLSSVPYEVLCIDDAHPFPRTRHILSLTDQMSWRPVVIVATREVAAEDAVELMEGGAFTVLAGEISPDKVRAAVRRASENRATFRKILNLDRSLQRNRNSLEQKTLELYAEKVKLQGKVEEVTTMRKVAQWLGTANALEEGLQKVLPAICRFTGISRGAFVVSLRNGQWVQSCTGFPDPSRFLFPRDVSRFPKAAFLCLPVSPDGTPGPLDGDDAGSSRNAVAFPVRSKGRFLGYGVLWGSQLSDPSSDTLRSLDAIGIQVGSFCERLVLNGEVASERDRLARANEELGFLYRLASSFHGDADMDAVFAILCKEIRRFVPCAGIGVVSLAGQHSVHAGGRLRLPGDEGAIGVPGPSDWVAYLSRRYGISLSADDLDVQETPFGPEGNGNEEHPRGERAAREYPLRFGRETVGILLVQLVEDVPDDSCALRTLQAVCAQLSLFLRNRSEQDKVRTLAIQDGLTGLYNRRYLQKVLEREFALFTRYGHPLTLMMIDLDHFKEVNDTFGHRVGDLVLEKAAETLRSMLRKTDYAFRYGGDEFAVLMTNSTADQASIFAARIQAEIRKQILEMPEYRRPLSISVGIADTSSPSSRDREELLLRADGALYRAKAHGRDRIETAEERGTAARLKGDGRHAVQTLSG